MENELILLTDYIASARVEIDFVLRLEEEGLIETTLQNDVKYLLVSQLRDLELFSHLYYDLSINIEGIDVIHGLLTRLREAEQELGILRRMYEA